jgi:hypothetical protein
MFAASLCALERRTWQLANRLAEETWFGFRQDQQVSAALDNIQPDIQTLQAFLPEGKWAGREADYYHPSADKKGSVRHDQGTRVIIVLGAFTKLRKATISFAMSVRPATNGRIFMKVDI